MAAINVQVEFTVVQAQGHLPFVWFKGKERALIYR